MSAPKKILAALSITTGIAVQLRKKTTAKTPLALIERMERAGHRAFDAFNYIRVDAKTVRRISEQISRFEQHQFNGQEHPAPVYLSFALALLDDIRINVKIHEKKKAIEALEDAAFRLHKYYDRKLDRNAWYSQADQAFEGWMEILS